MAKDKGTETVNSNQEEAGQPYNPYEEVTDTQKETPDTEHETLNTMDKIEDAEIVSETTKENLVTETDSSNTSNVTTGNTASQLLSLEQMIKGYMGDITKIQERIKSQKEMFTQSFEQDKAYSEVAEEAKKLNKKKTEQKQRIVKSDAVSAVQMKIDELQDELKETRQSLSDYLNRYIMLTQKSEFLGPDGESYQIVRSAKLVKKK